MHLFMGALSYDFQRTLLRQWQDTPIAANMAEAVARLIKPYEVRVAHGQAGTLHSRLLKSKTRVSSPTSLTEPSTPTVPAST